MATTRTDSIESQCRAFAAEFPTPNTLEAIAHAEAGRVTWEAIHGLFIKSLKTALKTVGAS